MRGRTETAWRRIDWLMERGWTRAGIAEELGVTDLRRGRKVSADLADKIGVLYREERDARSRTHDCRLPLAPLEVRLCAHLDRRGVHTRGSDPWDPLLVSSEELAELVGVTSRTWNRWRVDGVPILRADLAAVAIDAHPLDIWPDFHTAVMS